jgi:hypothetical protein
MQSWYVKGRSWAGALHGSDNGELAKEHEGGLLKLRNGHSFLRAKGVL